MGDSDLHKIFRGVNELKVHQSEDQLVIALDFGTTFSGIAYAFAKGGKPDLVSVLDWPGEDIIYKQKVDFSDYVCRPRIETTQDPDGHLL